MKMIRVATAIAITLGLGGELTAPAQAQTSPPPAADAQAAAPTVAVPAPAAEKQQSLVLYFDQGSATVRAGDVAILDQASRLYRDGQPIVMILSGSADAVGAPIANLALSQRRANAVLAALVARGIPAGRFQVLAKGETEPVVPASVGKPEPLDRRVEISWR